MITSHENQELKGAFSVLFIASWIWLISGCFVKFILLFRSLRNFEFKLNTCVHNTRNEFGFHKFRFQEIVFI